MAKTFPSYNTMTFQQLFPSSNDFIESYRDVGLGGLQDENVNKLYYLLYGYYGNNPLANMDINQSTYKLFSIVFMYGPT